MAQFFLIFFFGDWTGQVGSTFARCILMRECSHLHLHVVLQVATGAFWLVLLYTDSSIRLDTWEKFAFLYLLYV